MIIFELLAVKLVMHVSCADCSTHGFCTIAKRER